MELTGYELTNRFGKAFVDEAEARHVYATWPNGRDQYVEGDLESGFTAWVDSEFGGRLMGTRYEPVPPGQEAQR